MTRIIGKSIPRFDAIAKVRGAALYPSDIPVSNPYILKTVFSPVPHAIIKQVKIDEALKIPGIVMILTAKDVPCNEYGLLVNDQPVLCGPGSSKQGAEKVRFIGDRIAFIIAENESSASLASQAMQIEYENLPVINELEQSKKDDVLIHQDCKSNRCSHFQIYKGDCEKGFHNADVIIEDDYYTPVQEHAFLQPEAGVAFMDEQNIIHVITAGQWTHGDQRQIAHALQIPEEHVCVEYAAIGGAFGGKEDISLQIALALAVQRLDKLGIKKTIRAEWSREESFRGHPKRHAFHIHAKWGATSDGKICAAEMRIEADAGAYASSSEVVLKSAAIAAIGPYEIPNATVIADAYFTNSITAGAFRGFGVPQICYAVEMQMNKIAEALQMDAVVLRLRNAMTGTSLSLNQSTLPDSVSVKNVITSCAEEAGWYREETGWKKKSVISRSGDDKYLYGTGFAAGFKSFGIPPDECWAKIELQGKSKIETVRIYHAAADMGQGVHSLLKQIAAEIIPFPYENMELFASDTRTSKSSGSASASRLTYMTGNAILNAAKSAMEHWNMEERPAIGEFLYQSPETTEMDEMDGKGKPNFGYGYAAEAVDVRIDRETGMIDVLNIVCADDVGKAINPQQVKGQIEGCVIQALGYSTNEEIIQKDGYLLTKGLSTYLVPTIKDIAGIFICVFVEEASEEGPFGAKGIGEIPFGPFAPALCAAVHDACGKWFNSLPLKPEKVILKLAQDRK